MGAEWKAFRLTSGVYLVIKAVIFDIDGVLVDSFEANLKFIQDLFKKAGLNTIKRAQYKKDGFNRSLKDVIRIYGQCKNEKEVEDVMQLANKVKRYPNLQKFPPHLRETLKQISKSYALGIATSRIKIGVDNVLHSSKIEKYFSVVVHYGQYKNPKPDPESLLLALKLLRTKPYEAVYIGDSFTDIQAAKAARMKMILFSKRKMNGADLTTAKFAELPKMISKL